MLTEKPGAVVDQLTGLGVFAQAEQHERRVERQRRERVRRHRPDFAVDVDRDHRDAGDEVPDGLPEGPRVDVHITPSSRLVSGLRRHAVEDSYVRSSACVIFFMMTLTSSERIMSGTVQPSRSYSAMHCSAKPL